MVAMPYIPIPAHPEPVEGCALTPAQCLDRAPGTDLARMLRQAQHERVWGILVYLGAYEIKSGLTRKGYVSANG